MPSPFPGIDPYIESQGYWPDFHQRLMTYACDALNDHLPETYEARLGEQLRLVDREEPVARTFLPVVAILESGGIRAGGSRDEGGVLTLEPVTLELPSIELEEVRDLWIEIRRRPERELVTAIEILSPTNKQGMGYRDYLAKRSELIHQPIHVVELDLLIRGQRLPMKQALPPGDFYAIVSRAERRRKSEVFAWTVRQPLPQIPIPLRAPDPDVTLNLSELFAEAYRKGRYVRALDYGAGLDLPLPLDEKTWAEGIARGSGPPS
jgi:hypothetical protein